MSCEGIVKQATDRGPVARSRAAVLRWCLLLVLAGAALLLGALVATARAAEFGGLGGLAVFKPGHNGAHLEVNPRGHRAFGVAPDGSSYIADEIEAEGKHYFRIQKLGPKGEYLAEARVKLANLPFQLDGIAIDAEKQRLYVLVVGERKVEEEHPVFDPEAPVAAELYAFSTIALEPATGTTAGLLTGEKVLSPLSEEAGVPLLRPHGIAVDLATHDILILGQQDVSAKKGLGEADLRAAAQRVHTEGPNAGKLGPRYLDKQNCLDEGRAIESEPACAEGFGQPSSPFVAPSGRLYGERLGELWEIPTMEGAAEAFESRPKEYEAKPKRLFTMGRKEGINGEESIVEPVSEEEGAGGALAFVPTGAGEGEIYLDAEITAEEGEGRRSQSRGAVLLSYNESGATPIAKEFGWTAGQNTTGENVKCILPLGTAPVLVGAGSSGRLLLFDVTTAVLSKHEPATVNVLQFGAGGEGCGHARATPPSVSVLGEPVTKVPAGKTASLSLNVFAADALGVEWRFKNTTTGKEEADEQPVIESYPLPTQVPALIHEFKHGGNYEIIAIVQPDDFGPQMEEHSDVTVEGGEGGNGGASIGVEFSYTSPVTVSQPAKFAAKVTDPNNKTSQHAQYKYVWEFGDGAKTEGSGGREFRAEHAYAGTGRYEVKLTVTDEGGRSTEATHLVQVNIPITPATISSLGTGSGGGSGGGSSGGSTGASSAGISVVTSTHVPDATLAGTMSLAVNRSGVLTLKLACPAGETSCSGTVMLRTLGAVKASAHGKKRVLTLAAGSFTVVGGRVKTVTLHLSAVARALLVRSHVLPVQATVQAHDPAGAIHTTQAIVTLRLSKHVNKR